MPSCCIARSLEPATNANGDRAGSGSHWNARGVEGGAEQTSAVRLLYGGFDDGAHQLVALGVGMEAVAGSSLLEEAFLVHCDRVVVGVHCVDPGGVVLEPGIEPEDVTRRTSFSLFAECVVADWEERAENNLDAVELGELRDCLKVLCDHLNGLRTGIAGDVIRAGEHDQRDGFEIDDIRKHADQHLSCRLAADAPVDVGLAGEGFGEAPTVGNGIPQENDAAGVGRQGFEALVVGMVATELIPILELIGEALRRRGQAAAGARRLELIDELGLRVGGADRSEQNGGCGLDRKGHRGIFYYFPMQALTIVHPLLASLLAVGVPAPAADAPRPSPKTVKTWQDRKFGLFIHWGLYSIAGGVWGGKPVTYGYSEQILMHAPAPKAEYEALAKQFTASRFDADFIAGLAVEAGMKYVVLTSKHHDGFNLFGTKLSKYNVVDATPYGKDVVRQLADACRRRGLDFGVYYSTIDWNFPGASPPDAKRNSNPIPPEHEEFNVGQLRELLTGYGPIAEIWFDMGKPTPAQSRRFVNTVHELQPECMVSGRVFNHQGDFTVMGDNAIPKFVIDEPWQTPASIYHQTWGYRSWQKRDDLEGKIREHIIKLAEVSSRGGNYLLNIGPKGDGEVLEFEASVLRGVGQWLRQNGEAIYGARAQPFRELPFGYATVKPGRLYLLVRDRPVDGVLRLPGLKTKLTRARYLAGPAGARLTTGSGFVRMEINFETAPLTVIEAVYKGTLEITPPLVQPAADGTVTLPDGEADRFFNYNGYGYYERPTVYKQKWSFAAKQAGRYRLELEPRPEQFSIELDGRNLGDASVVVLDRAEYHTISLTPRVPFVKGDRLAPPVNTLRLLPER